MSGWRCEHGVPCDEDGHYTTDETCPTCDGDEIASNAKSTFRDVLADAAKRGCLAAYIDGFGGKAADSILATNEMQAIRAALRRMASSTEVYFLPESVIDWVIGGDQ